MQRLEVSGVVRPIYGVVRRQTVNVHPSVRMYQRGSPWTNFREIWYLGVGFYDSVSRISKFGCNLTKISGMLHEERTIAIRTPLHHNTQFFLLFAVTFS